jgi:hypothetical protein
MSELLEFNDPKVPDYLKKIADLTPLTRFEA